MFSRCAIRDVAPESVATKTGGFGFGKPKPVVFDATDSESEEIYLSWVLFCDSINMLDILIASQNETHGNMLDQFQLY